MDLENTLKPKKQIKFMIKEIKNPKINCENNNSNCENNNSNCNEELLCPIVLTL